jgi:hypothetical protein
LNGIDERQKMSFERFKQSWEPVAHTCNLGYSGGRDQENHSLKPAGGNSSARSYLEKTLHRIPRWRLEVGSRKRPSYSEILERRWRHTLQA